MRDLRLRFGFVLALAMLPLLIFSIWQSYYDYARDKEARNTALVLSARQSATQVLNTLERAESVLRAVDQTLSESEDCSLIFKDIATEFPGFEQFYVADANGQYTCATDKVIGRTQTFEHINRLSPDRPTALIKRNVMTTRLTASPIIRVAYGRFETGQLKRVLIIDVATRALKLDNEPLPIDSKDIQISILSSNADILAGANIEAADLRMRLVDNAKAEGEFRTQDHGTGRKRDLVIVPTTNADTFIVFSQPYQNVLSWNLVNPLSSALVPIIAWIFGSLAIWIATDKLILTHLRVMRTSLLRFARGDSLQRVGTMKNPPDSIRELGRTIDIMADKITSREAELADSLDEKDVLLREIHHRVKNNLQIIMSLLNMQERKLKDPKGLAAIKDTRSRINAIALVHRGLYESEDLRYIPMDVFIDRLMDELGLALGAEALGIIITSETDCKPLETDTAIPVALFFVEAMTNSIKHAVAGGGTIHVTLKQMDDEITASVIDSGPGFDQDVEATGTGTKLLRGFARQLSGDLSHKTFEGGHAIKMTFTHRPFPSRI